MPVAEQKAATPKKGSPWSGLGRMLTDEEWAELKVWRKENPRLRFTRGDPGHDGDVFRSYSRRCANGEWWVTIASLQAFNKVSQSRRRQYWLTERAKRRASPEKMKRYREYHRQYRKTMTPRQKLMIVGYWKKRRRRGRHVKTVGPKHAGIKILYKRADVLSVKGGLCYEVDHIIPVGSGGPHHPLNLQVIPQAANREKSANEFWLSDEHMDFRDVPEFLWPDHLKPHYQLLLRIFGHPLKKYAEAV